MRLNEFTISWIVICYSNAHNIEREREPWRLAKLMGNRVTFVLFIDSTHSCVVRGSIALLPRKASCASLNFLDSNTVNWSILILVMGVVDSIEPSFPYKARKTQLYTNQNLAAPHHSHSLANHICIIFC